MEKDSNIYDVITTIVNFIDKKNAELKEIENEKRENITNIKGAINYENSK